MCEKDHGLRNLLEGRQMQNEKKNEVGNIYLKDYYLGSCYLPYLELFASIVEYGCAFLKWK